MSRARHRVNTRGAARTGLGRLTGLVVVSTAVTATVVTAGVGGAGFEADALQAQQAGYSGSAGAAIGSLDLDRVAATRQLRVSRTADRVRLEPEPVDRKFASTALNVWTEPRQQGKKLRVLEKGTKLAVTGQVVGRWSEVLLEKDAVRWVNNDFLADRKPKPKPIRASSTLNGLK